MCSNGALVLPAVTQGQIRMRFTIGFGLYLSLYYKHFLADERSSAFIFPGQSGMAAVSSQVISSD